ncbi:MAG: dimethylarginine dimethylaminohydrolase family protein [Ilumatobacteraceae bacterium]
MTTSTSWGTPDMVSQLSRVLVRTPTTVGRFVEEGFWRMPDTTELLKEHEKFTNLLESLGCQVDVASPVEGLVDAVYMHDPMIMTPHGAILLRMAKQVRSPEPAEFRKDLERIGVPILGQLTEPAFADGGDKVWLDAKTLLIGHGYRTNQAGIDQIRALLTQHGVDVFSFDLPHYEGPGAVLHLMSVLSPIAHNKAVVYEPLAPVRLLQFLESRGISWFTVSEKEMLTQGANILTIRPNVVVLAAGNPEIEGKLREGGVEVHVFAGNNVAVKGDGGPTCLTAPLLRITQ